VLLTTLSTCSGQNITAICGNNITISVVGDSDFPVESSDARANASGLVLGHTEYCDDNGGAPASECTFARTAPDTFQVEIDDFNSCGITTVYKSYADYTEVTVLVSRIPYLESSLIRRSECGRVAVICRYAKTLQNVTYDKSICLATHDLIGANVTTSANISDIGLYLIEGPGTGSAAGTDVSPGKVYSLTDTVYVEARIANHTDKFVSTLYNCFASETDDYDDNYELIGSNGCGNVVDGTVQVDNGTTPTTPRYFPYFSFEAFVWTSLETEIYVHCDVDACLEGDSACVADMTRCPTLMSRYRREASSLKTMSLRSGPIRVRRANAVKNTLIGEMSINI